MGVEVEITLSARNQNTEDKTEIRPPKVASNDSISTGNLRIGKSTLPAVFCLYTFDN